MKQQLRLDDDELSAQEDVLAVYVDAARRECEAYTNLQLITSTYVLRLDSWYESEIYRCEDGGAPRLRLPKGPVSSITSIQYYDQDNVLQTWNSANYALAQTAGDETQRGEIVLAAGVTFPIVYPKANAIVITFVSGFGAAYTAVPKPLKAGMLLMVSELYERREEATVGTNVLPNLLTAKRLWTPYRAW